MKKANFSTFAKACSWVIALVAMLGMNTTANAQSCELVCQDLVHISLGAGTAAAPCTYTLTPADILQNQSAGCAGSTLLVQVKKGTTWQPALPALGPIPTNAVVDATYKGVPCEVRVVQVLGAGTDANPYVVGQTCWGRLIVEDKLAPNLFVRDITLPCTFSKATASNPYKLFNALPDIPALTEFWSRHRVWPNQLVTYDPACNGNTTNQVVPMSGSSDVYTVAAGVGTPILEYCSAVMLTWSDEHIDYTCSNPPVPGISYRIIRNWRATDANGNLVQRRQIIDFERINPALVEWPADVTTDRCDLYKLKKDEHWNDVTTATPEALGSVPIYTPGRCPNILGAGPDPAGTQWPQFCFNGWTAANCAQATYPVYPNNTCCEFQVKYVDMYFPVCEGTFKIQRMWTLLDWCGNTIIEDTQIIKVESKQGARVIMPANFCGSTVEVVGTPIRNDQFGKPVSCAVSVQLPTVMVEGGCSAVTGARAEWESTDMASGTKVKRTATGTVTKAGNEWASQANITFGAGIFDDGGDWNAGTTPVTYYFLDACGNPGTPCVFTLKVRNSPPVPICIEQTQVSLGADGMAWVQASSLDNGSYDNCGQVSVKVRRMLDNKCQSPFTTTDDPCTASTAKVADTLYFDAVKFCCDPDCGKEVQVILRVFDRKLPAGPVSMVELNCASRNVASAVHGIQWNDCMVTVLVDDKLKPWCIAPPAVTVDCDKFDPTLWNYGQFQYGDNCEVKDTATLFDYSLFDKTCNYGQVRRLFTVTDKNGLKSTCAQNICVNYRSQFKVVFPVDVVLNCDDDIEAGRPVITGDDCENIAVLEPIDEVYTVVADACYKIVRKWRVIDWCTYSPNGGCYVLPNAGTAAGRTISRDCYYAWNGNLISAAATAAGVALGGANLDAACNCFEYTQVIKVLDNEKPTITAEVDPCDYTQNLCRYWNDGDKWWDGGIHLHDLCEAPVELCSYSIDECNGISSTNLSVQGQLFLDLDGDGKMETRLTGTAVKGTAVVMDGQPAQGKISFNNFDPILGQVLPGSSRFFDYAGQPTGQFTASNFWRKQFYVRATEVNGKLKACIVWNKVASPDAANDAHWENAEIPYIGCESAHKVKWTVNDNCGNINFTENIIRLKDCKKPTVVGEDVTVNIMNTDPAMVTIWASDFLKYGEDNCTTPYNKAAYEAGGLNCVDVSTDLLEYGIRVSEDGKLGATFPTASSLTFDCDDVAAGAVFVEVWAKDKCGNADGVVVLLFVQDNMGNCPGDKANVAGAAMVDFTNAASGVEDADVKVTANTPAAIKLDMLTKTNDKGAYLLPKALPLSSTAATVSLLKNDNPTNGVDVSDLLAISKHILGSKPFTSPYQWIAADANKSGSITTFDMVEARKLLLGITTELPNNTSWRFVRKDQTFNALNPLATVIEESFGKSEVTGNIVADFQAVKVLDINGDAVANSNQSADDRTSGVKFFDIADTKVKAGEEVTVNFKAAEQLTAYQFAMTLNGLEVKDIAAGANMTAENFAVFNNQLAAVVETGAGEFAVTFRATKSGNLHEMITVSEERTDAKAFNEAGEEFSVSLRFNGQNGSIVTGAGFDLLQNTPNPVSAKTFITFNLPEAANATLTISDAAGRVIKTINAEYAKGVNTVELNRADLTAGVLFYQLSTANNSAVKKMIVVD